MDLTILGQTLEQGDVLQKNTIQRESATRNLLGITPIKSLFIISNSSKNFTQH